jgi:hypothetical protein
MLDQSAAVNRLSVVDQFRTVIENQRMHPAQGILEGFVGHVSEHAIE